MAAIISKARRAATSARVTLRRVAGRSDVGRWGRADSLSPAWDERTVLMLEGTAPDARVLDIGAGNQVARKHLPPPATYVPVDLVARTPDTVVCDLNRDDLPDLEGDLVLASGVLEYVNRPSRVLDWFHRTAPRCALSYATLDRMPSVAERRGHGWVNDLSEAALIETVTRSGFTVERRAEWQSQLVLYLRRADG